MAQHDYDLANQSGAAFRADLNNALLAIASHNSGASAPSTTYAYMPWIDTSASPPRIKVRNAANTAWEDFGEYLAYPPKTQFIVLEDTSNRTINTTGVSLSLGTLTIPTKGIIRIAGFTAQLTGGSSTLDCRFAFTSNATRKYFGHKVVTTTDVYPHATTSAGVSTKFYGTLWGDTNYDPSDWVMDIGAESLPTGSQSCSFDLVATLGTDHTVDGATLTTRVALEIIDLS